MCRHSSQVQSGNVMRCKNCADIIPMDNNKGKSSAEPITADEVNNILIAAHILATACRTDANTVIEKLTGVLWTGGEAAVIQKAAHSSP